jgi:hypothetical protein
MGTEESIFTILMHNHGDIISQFSIEGNGLVWPFFEELKSGSVIKKIINQDYLDACYRLGDLYKDFCSSIFIIAKKK